MSSGEECAGEQLGGLSLSVGAGCPRPCSREPRACCLYRVRSFEGGTSDSDPLRSSLPRAQGFPPQPESCWEASCKLSVSWVLLCTGGEHCPFADCHKIRRISVWLLSSCWTVRPPAAGGPPPARPWSLNTSSPILRTPLFSAKSPPPSCPSHQMGSEGE